MTVALAWLALAGCTGGTPTLHITPAPTPPAASASVPAGARNPAVTQATLPVTVCRAGWTATVRTRLSTRPGYQHDHFIPLELGGAPSDPANLWFVPTARAHRDDLAENRLHRQLCAGRLTLAQAQARIAQEKRTPR